MRKIAFISSVLVLGACGVYQPGVQVVTATPNPATATPIPTDTPPPPTNTPVPSATPTETPTSVPTLTPVSIAEIEAALGDHGYRRFPTTSADGLKGFTWIKGNAYEQIETWENGTVRLEVLHDRSAAVRRDHVEEKLVVLEQVFPAEFMTALREEHERYNREVGPSISGDPAQLHNYGDEWKTVLGEYNVDQVKIQGYDVRFSLWWWQSTCPPQYLYCYYEGFPGLEFTGDSSFVFHSMEISPPETEPGGSSSA